MSKRLTSEPGSGVTLGIKIDKECSSACHRQTGGQIDGGRRFSYATFLVGNTDDAWHKSASLPMVDLLMVLARQSDYISGNGLPAALGFARSSGNGLATPGDAASLQSGRSHQFAIKQTNLPRVPRETAAGLR